MLPSHVELPTSKYGDTRMDEVQSKEAQALIRALIGGHAENHGWLSVGSSLLSNAVP
jgi:hypothetical protein